MKRNTKQKLVWAFSIAFMLMLLGTALNIAVTSSFGGVKMRRVRYSDGLGNMVSAQLYIPDTATADTPAPAVMTNHGGGNSSEIQSSFNIELSRRGFVVLSWDASNSGSSEISKDPTHGGEATYRFLQTLDYVQKDQLGASGHSMGGVYTFDVAQAHPEHVKLVVPVGMNPAMNDIDSPLDTNYVCIIGEHDESSLVRNDGDIMNLVRSNDYHKLFGMADGEVVEVNTIYGNWEDGTVRAFFMPNSTHAGEMINREVLTIYLEMMQTALPTPHYIDPANQVWYWKDVGMGLQMAGLIVLLFSLAAALLRTRTFSGLMLPERKPVGFAPKSPLWTASLALLLLLPVVLFIPAATLAQRIDITSVFGLDNTANGFAFWGVCTGLVLLVLFGVFHLTHGKKAGGTLMTYGLATEAAENRLRWRYLLQALLFSFCIVGTTYIVYLLMYNIAGGDVHLWLATIRPVTLLRARFYPLYFLVQIPYFTASSLAGRSININNGSRSSGKGMRNSVVMSTLIGTGGLLCLFLLFFAVSINTGTVLFPQNRGYIYAGAIFSMLPAFVIGNALNCYITNKTNSIYAGILSAALWTTWLMVGANALA